MKKRLFLLLLICLFPVMLFAGCSPSIRSKTGTRYDIGGITFIKIEDNGTFGILVDIDTRVMYIVNTEFNGGGMSVLCNSDGTPMLWKGDL